MSEPWIRVHANLAGKPVIARAVSALGVSENEAIGLMVRFWGSVSQHAVNGYVRNATDRQIELWAGWPRKRGRFAAFIRSAHLDIDGRVNEWDEYAGKLEARRAQDRARKEEERARKSRGGHADSPQDVTLNSIPARENETTTTRNETDTPVVVDSGGSEITRAANGHANADYALQLTVAANHAITKRWGEQTHPLVLGQSYALTDELMTAGVPLDVAKASVALQCERSGKPVPPKAINWFKGGIIHHHAEIQQRVADERIAAPLTGRVTPNKSNPRTPATAVAASAAYGKHFE